MANKNWLGPQQGTKMVVAGGCGGIGKALVAEALERGLEVIVLDLERSMSAANQFAGAKYVPFDARSEVSITQAVSTVAQHWTTVDSFVFLCGYPILPRCKLEQTSLEAWNELMTVNFTSAYLLTSGLLPLLKTAEHPTIVTVASSLGYQVMPGMGAYATSKGALISLTKAIAAENAPHIRCNAVAPGAVETDFLGGGTGRGQNIAEGRAWFDKLNETYISSIPLNRVAKPSDITGPIFFLAGEGSAYMTGQVLHLNGGRLTP